MEHTLLIGKNFLHGVRLHVLLLLFLMSLTGCPKDGDNDLDDDGKDDTKEVVIKIDLSTSRLDFTSSGGDLQFTLESNASTVIISCEERWLLFEWNYISSRAIDVKVIAAANTSASQRTAIITFSAGEENRRTITVTQDGNSPVFSNGIVAAVGYGGGDGSKESPYLIADARQLKRLADEVNNNRQTYTGTCFKLMADIEVTASEWIPIGQNLTVSFHGNFDGNGHTVKGALKSDNFRYFGFFGYLRDGARVSGLTIAATVVNNYTESSAATGGISGTATSYPPDSVVISNCHVTGQVTGGLVSTSYPSTGGIIGSIGIFCAISNCDVSGSVTGSEKSATGGIVGSNMSDGEITNCKTHAFTSITGGSYIGGIAGTNHWDGKISDCTNDAVIISGSNTYYGGGIVGSNNGFDSGERGGVISNCTNNGAISGVYSAGCGGITGENQKYALIIDCTNNADVTNERTSGLPASGGITGENRGIIHTCLNIGNIKGNDQYHGGIAGRSNDYVYDCNTNLGELYDLNGRYGGWRDIGNLWGNPTPCPDGHAKRQK